MKLRKQGIEDPTAISKRPKKLMTEEYLDTGKVTWFMSCEVVSNSDKNTSKLKGFEFFDRLIMGRIDIALI